VFSLRSIKSVKGRERRRSVYVLRTERWINPGRERWRTDLLTPGGRVLGRDVVVLKLESVAELHEARAFGRSELEETWMDLDRLQRRTARQSPVRKE
jgi:hypothetical protein